MKEILIADCLLYIDVVDLPTYKRPHCIKICKKNEIFMKDT